MHSRSVRCVEKSVVREAGTELGLTRLDDFPVSGAVMTGWRSPTFRASVSRTGEAYYFQHDA